MTDNKKIIIWAKTMNAFSRSCHQLPERSFYYHDYQFPVCARCTGLAIGYVLAIFMLLFHVRLSLILSCIFIIPCLIDGTLQLKTQYHSNNFKRLMTGIMAGTGFVYSIYTTIILVIKSTH